MSGLLEGCKTYFGTQNLYEVLQVENKANENEGKGVRRDSCCLLSSADGGMGDSITLE